MGYNPFTACFKDGSNVPAEPAVFPQTLLRQPGAGPRRNPPSPGPSIPPAPGGGGEARPLQGLPELLPHPEFQGQEAQKLPPQTPGGPPGPLSAPGGGGQKGVPLPGVVRSAFELLDVKGQDGHGVAEDAVQLSGIIRNGAPVFHQDFHQFFMPSSVHMIESGAVRRLFSTAPATGPIPRLQPAALGIREKRPRKSLHFRTGRAMINPSIS